MKTVYHIANEAVDHLDEKNWKAPMPRSYRDPYIDGYVAGFNKAKEMCIASFPEYPHVITVLHTLGESIEPV